MAPTVRAILHGMSAALLFLLLALHDEAAARNHSCSVAGNNVCAGCSVSCPRGQAARCREGEVTGSTCWTRAVCECLGPVAAPSVVTPGPGGGANANACSTPDNGACLGCSASCPPDRKPICSPAIPDVFDKAKCVMAANCRCEKRRH